MVNNGQSARLKCRRCGHGERASLLIRPAQIAVTDSCPECGSAMALVD